MYRDLHLSLHTKARCSCHLKLSPVFTACESLVAVVSLSRLSEAQSLIRCSSLQSSELQRWCKNELLSVSTEQGTPTQVGAALSNCQNSRKQMTHTKTSIQTSCYILGDDVRNKPTVLNGRQIIFNIYCDLFCNQLHQI